MPGATWSCMMYTDPMCVSSRITEAASLRLFRCGQRLGHELARSGQIARIVVGNREFAIRAVRPLCVASGRSKILYEFPIPARDFGKLQLVIAVSFGDVQPHPDVSVPANNRVLLQSSEGAREFGEIALLHRCSEEADARENAGPRGRTRRAVEPAGNAVAHRSICTDPRTATRPRVPAPRKSFARMKPIRRQERRRSGSVEIISCTTQFTTSVHAERPPRAERPHLSPRPPAETVRVYPV